VITAWAIPIPRAVVCYLLSMRVIYTCARRTRTKSGMVSWTAVPAPLPTPLRDALLFSYLSYLDELGGVLWWWMVLVPSLSLS
jgi:hypothetical protein